MTFICFRDEVMILCCILALRGSVGITYHKSAGGQNTLRRELLEKVSQTPLSTKADTPTADPLLAGGTD